MACKQPFLLNLKLSPHPCIPRPGRLTMHYCRSKSKAQAKAKAKQSNAKAAPDATMIAHPATTNAEEAKKEADERFRMTFIEVEQTMVTRMKAEEAQKAAEIEQARAIVASLRAQVKQANAEAAARRAEAASLRAHAHRSKAHWPKSPGPKTAKAKGTKVVKHRLNYKKVWQRRVARLVAEGLVAEADKCEENVGGAMASGSGTASGGGEEAMVSDSEF